MKQAESYNAPVEGRQYPVSSGDRRSNRRSAPFLALALALFIAGCSTANRIATSQNAYDFRFQRFSEACNARPRTATDEWCKAQVLKLNAYEVHLHEAARALKNGGRLPLQMKAIAADEKSVAK